MTKVCIKLEIVIHLNLIFQIISIFDRFLGQIANSTLYLKSRNPISEARECLSYSHHWRDLKTLRIEQINRIIRSYN